MNTYFTSDIERLREAKKLEPNFYAKYKRKLILFTAIRWWYIIFINVIFSPITLIGLMSDIFHSLMRKLFDGIVVIVDTDKRFNLRRYISKKNKEYYKNLEENNK